jgi:two-component system sensor histidine kinase YesM
MSPASSAHTPGTLENPPRQMRAREYSLKRVLFLSLTFSCIFPLLLTGGISYFWLKNVLNNSVINSVKAAVRQNRSQVDSMVSVLDSVTQLAVVEFISKGIIESYVAAKNHFDTFKAAQDIRTSLTFLSFANPDIGLTILFDLGTGTIIWQSTAARETFDLGQMPRLVHRNTFTAFGPAPTLQRDRSDLVISAARLIPNSAGRQLYLYFEIGSRSLGSILNRKQYGITATHFVVNADGIISYSEDQASFPVGTAYTRTGGGDSWFYDSGHVVFSELGAAGWRMMVSFQRWEFDGARMRWLAGLIVASLLSLSASLLIAFFIWRILYMPLTGLRSELETVGGGEREKPAPRMPLREYSYLMDKVVEMRGRISTLIEELKANELTKRQLEVEKLLFQINPHFLYNTLNNVQWLARINGQQEISRLVADLTKVLHYNLRRAGEMASVKDEIEILCSYVGIQQRRLDLHIDLRLEIDPAAGDCAIPRFILQPLVENAIMHGQRDSISISVGVKRTPDGGVTLEVRDSGAGMSPETLRAVLSSKWYGPAERANGLGIRYVKSLIDMIYGERAVLSIESEASLGTTVSLLLPTEAVP